MRGESERLASYVREHARLVAWLLAGLSLLIGREILALVGWGIALHTVLFYLWLIPTLLAAAFWLWRKLTYRIGVRLLVSYLLIGVLPFFLVASFLVLVGYMVVGQYASVRYGQLEERLMWELERIAEEASEVLLQSGPQPARELLQKIAASPPALVPQLEWVLMADDRHWTSRLAAPEEPPPPGFRGAVFRGEEVYFAAVESSDRGRVAALLPVDLATARILSEHLFFEVRFTLGELGEDRSLSVEGGSGEEGDLRIEGRDVDEDFIEEDWFTLLVGEGSLVERLRIIWFRLGEEATNWEMGSVGDVRVISLLRVPVTAVVGDLFASGYELQEGFTSAVAGLAGFFSVLYLGAVALAGLLIFNVARSAARLSRGARAVGAGRLDYRIPVKRRDQLGDLAVAFNTMAESVEGMMQAVAERERLARDLELAREIQLGLLPEMNQEHGSLSVRACFRPAQEVGGDYFDLFPLPGSRLVVSAGDVAGHGLPTSLLMATVKSAVATLIAEGHSGGALLQRLNGLLREQSERTHMVTLALADIDTSTSEVQIVSAGHAPAFVMSPEGDLEEVLLFSLPLGHAWSHPPPGATLPFPPGSRLVFYSDGLVEATDAAGEPYGYERLKEELVAHRGMPAERLIADLLESVHSHAGSDSLEDDLTLVVVDAEGSGSP